MSNHPFTGERYVPEVEGEIELEHFHRYALARELARGKRVLDIACGEGYGSDLLASVADSVVGVDIAPEAVDHASRRYQRSNLKFRVGSCAQIPLAEHTVDLVVSFETLEHHGEHAEMMREIRRVLAPGGLLVISTPDKFEYSETPSSDNPFHAKELYLPEFGELLEAHFRNVLIYGQRIVCGSVIAPLDASSAPFLTLRRRGKAVDRHPGVFRPVYFVAVASDATLPVFPGGIYDGTAQIVSARDRQIAELSQVLAERTAALEQLSTGRLPALERELAERGRHIADLRELRQALRAERDGARRALADSEREVEALSRHVQALQADSAVYLDRIRQLVESTSWRITAPMRALKAAIRRLRSFTRPLRESAGRLDGVLFRWLLRDMGVSKRWDAGRASAQSPSQPEPAARLVVAPELAPFDPARDAEEYLALSSQLERLRAQALQSFEPTAPRVVSIEERQIENAASALALPDVPNPVVSIVIPVYNNIRLTLECLTAIVEHTAGADYEVIVVDDRSSDTTQGVLAEVRSLRYLRNEANLGFLRTCNRAIPEIRGAYCVFLNNDVQVTTGWLSALLGTFERFDCVGAVGPKILYPNGRLQEAGARLNRDCTTELIGVGDDPELPRYNYAREVEYSSAACLLLKTDVLRELGGFDETFVPAYCEDADLCFRLRRRGLRVVYNPEAVVVHHLSATTAATDPSYKLQLVARNQQKLAERWQQEIDALNDVRLIAFYLPQFHPIPENDRWWGAGFTDWTNVVRARPTFAGHYQPHLPSDLGFYDLRASEVMERQAELARRYGIYGFCYYYYWFAGKRLLEMPLERILQTGRPDLPFCLCWANENWTRRWDGSDNEVLMAQAHSDRDDEAVIRDLLRYFRHKNYIRVHGRPLLLVYRTTQFPNIRRTASIWRETCRSEGIGEIFLACVETFELAAEPPHPADFGFDASVEFPPHHASVPIDPPGTLLNSDFAGVVSDYRRVVIESLSRPIPVHTRFRGVMPSWDSTPRHPNRAYVFAHAWPGAYRAWLERVVTQTRDQNFGDERIVFVNAWNEWAEGAHLEPDCRFGHAFLEATRSALEADLLRPQCPSSDFSGGSPWSNAFPS